MTKRSIRINLESGLEARPVALLVQEASKYESTIYIQSGERRVNAKSIMGMMAIGLVPGDSVTITASGADEETAVSEIGNFLTNA